MLNKRLFILLLFVGVCMASSHSSYAQLLTDRNKLKTARRASGFLQAQKKAKIKGPSGKHKTVAAIKPKYSKPASREGSSRTVNPKFSVMTAGQARGRNISPRYSKNTAGQFRGRKPEVRYTQSHAGAGMDRKVNPRYSDMTAGQVKGRKLDIRYTQNKAGKGMDRKVTPRFSDMTAGQVKGRKLDIRYTQSHAGAGVDRKVTPRFSVMMAGQVKGKKINPRYSKINSGEIRGRNVKPRYSEWKQAGKVVVVNPRFTTPPTYTRTKPAGNREKGFLPNFNLYRKPTKYKAGPNSDYSGVMKNNYQKPLSVGDHNQNIKSYSKFSDRNLLFSPNAKMANFELKTKKLRKKSTMYPSAKYLSAKNNKSKVIRTTKRKFNVLWVRMNGNSIQPDAVKKKAKKAKFDKDEIDIWNN